MGVMANSFFFWVMQRESDIPARSRSKVPFSRPISGRPIQSSREHVDRLYIGDDLKGWLRVR